MISPLPRAPRDRRFCRCIAVTTLVAIYLSIFSGRGATTGTVFAAQAGGAVTPPAQTRPAARGRAPNHPPGKGSPTQNSPSPFGVKSKIALVVDANTSEEIMAKDADRVVPIASITKLMTAMVVIDAKPPMGEILKISDDDRDLVMGTSSRLRVGWVLSREDMLHLALMSSENRAAAALSRYYPGGRPAFIKAMNAKAAELGMAKTHFVNPNGLTTENVSTAHDLVKLVRAADQYQLIRQFTTDPWYEVRIGRYTLLYINSNRLVGRPDWDIEVQKTGFTNEAGDCLVMQVNAMGRSLIMVFLDASGKLTRFADARRVLMQLEVAQKK